MKVALLFAVLLAQDCPSITNINHSLLPILSNLVKTSLFRYFKANLHKQCPFWDEQLLCTMQGCEVIPAGLDEIPEQTEKEQSIGLVDYSPTTLFKSEKKCVLDEEDFCFLEDEDDQVGMYINLLKNDERCPVMLMLGVDLVMFRYTGYAGESAKRVWSSIYNENCFGGANYGRNLPAALQKPQNQCLEEKTFYNLISGLHSSISLHICGSYYDSHRDIWFANETCFRERFVGVPERIDNLYFLWTVMVRAVSKLSPYLQNYPFCGGSDSEIIMNYVDQVIEATTTCPEAFDENVLFSQTDRQHYKTAFKTKFRNISQIMDCVGCEKCRLWGKIQVTGLGTALKILFSKHTITPKYTLKKAELVALMNTFHRIAESIDILEKFTKKVGGLNNPLDLEQFLADMSPIGFVRGYTFWIGIVLIILGAHRMYIKGREAEVKYQERMEAEKLKEE